MTDFERGFMAGLHAAVKEVQSRLVGRVRSGWVRFDRDAAELSDAIRATPMPAEPAHRQTQEHPFVAIWGSDGRVCGRCSLAPEAHASSAKPAPQRSPPPRYDDVYAAGVAAMDAEPARVEWEHASCGTCGRDDVPCKVDGIVWTCRDCWPAKPSEAARDTQADNCAACAAMDDPAPQLGSVPAPLPYDDRCATCGGSGWTYVSLGVHGYRGESCPDCTGAKPGEGGR